MTVSSTDNINEGNINFDVVIVGAGPAGLSTAIRLMQISANSGNSLKVAVIEKGAEVGSHILSGAILDPIALTELIPDWALRGAPVTTKVSREKFILLTQRDPFFWPQWMLPKEMKHQGCYIVKLGELCKWLAKEAEELGVDIITGFTASSYKTNSNGAVTGITTGDFGINRNGERGSLFQKGIELNASVTVFAEGCRGSLSEQIIDNYDLRSDSDPQTYGLGFKEIWRLPPGKVRPGHVTHTAGWPLLGNAFGGGFLYELEENLASVGLVVALDYSNPHLDPFKEFQKFKTHPFIKKFLKDGERLSYGARSIAEGGFQSLPRLSFPGGVLVGDSAGFLNAARSKGIHTAMKSGMIAADSIIKKLANKNVAPEFEIDFNGATKKTWLMKELYRSRNFRPGMRWGFFTGIVHAGIDLLLLRGKAPWTLHNSVPDHKKLMGASIKGKISYPEPDNIISFDRSSSAYASGVNHHEDQPKHLKVVDEQIPINFHLPQYDLPELRICPVGVYELAENNQNLSLQINASNCIHCKACEIKDPSSNILWTVPEGGGGPNYLGM